VAAAAHPALSTPVAARHMSWVNAEHAGWTCGGDEQACAYYTLNVDEGFGNTGWTLPESVKGQDMYMHYLNSLEWSIATTFSFAVASRSERHLEGSFTIICMMTGEWSGRALPQGGVLFWR
jgi:hypothetical protein